MFGIKIESNKEIFNSFINKSDSMKKRVTLFDLFHIIDYDWTFGIGITLQEKDINEKEINLNDWYDYYVRRISIAENNVLIIDLYDKIDL